MNFKNWIFYQESIESRVPQISYQEVMNRKLFGPVYHGTSEEKRQSIADTGFKVFVGGARQGEISHGYESGSYGSTGISAPIHHLGYGVYFTTVKSILRSYNYGSTKGLKEYYLDVPRLETINFGSPNTMMKWWRSNGYNMDESGWADHDHEQKRVEATKNLTDVLRSKYDAVYFKGKGLTRLLDGNQICVFDPHRIYELNTELAGEGEVSPNDRFVVKNTNVVVRIKAVTQSYFSVSFKDPENQIKKIYGKEIIDDAIRKHPGLEERIMQNYNTDRESALEIYLNYYIDKGLKYNFPKKWLGRKLKKGERP